MVIGVENVDTPPICISEKLVISLMSPYNQGKTPRQTRAISPHILQPKRVAVLHRGRIFRFSVDIINRLAFTKHCRHPLLLFPIDRVKEIDSCFGDAGASNCGIWEEGIIMRIHYFLGGELIHLFRGWGGKNLDCLWPFWQTFNRCSLLSVSLQKVHISGNIPLKFIPHSNMPNLATIRVLHSSFFIWEIFKADHHNKPPDQIWTH